MDGPQEIRDFLTTRRARLTPQQAGLPDFGGRRRVPGLRREEVALLAGMSTEYYVRLERGNGTGYSEGVLDGVSRALQLDDAERSHLYDLVRAANESGLSKKKPIQPRKRAVRASLQQTIDAMSTVPVYVQNGRLDCVTMNKLGQALFSEMFRDTRPPANAARFTFLDPRSQDFYVDWEANARQIVAVLRRESGRNPYDRNTSDLVGELSTRSELFAKLWSSHDVREHRVGTKSVHHPVVGRLDLTFEAMELAGDAGLYMLVFSAVPGSPSADGLALLSSWIATDDEQVTDMSRAETRDSADGK
ncbi:helix-turn-helix transcriptional regulator [Rhodococcus wratislaviensis]|uniref:helix-turn-helix transcriptional regulator n=1 Tax=Rhodococcus wratislaviensis TaxID=44752 RepID=UPI00351623FE